MQNFLIALLICSITMSGLALLYMVATPFLAKHYSPKGRYYVWLIIVLGLIIPFRPQWNTALINVEMPTTASSSVVQMPEAPSQVIQFIPPTLTLPPIDDVAILNASLSISWTWWQIGFAVWVAGVIVFLAIHGIKHYRFIRMVRRWSVQVVDGHIPFLLESIKSEMGITRHIPIYLCKSVGSPMMIGLFKPRILLPTVELPQDEMHFILKHELVHFKRKDLLYKYLVMVATAIHWFNPVVCLMARAVNILCETSCDSEVLQNADETTRQSYGETIIGVVQYHSKLKTAYSTNFYGGKNSMKTRISSIMDMGKKKMGALIMSLVLVATLCTGVLVVFAAIGNGIPELSPYIIRVEMPTTETNVAVADFDTRTNRVVFYDANGNVVSYSYLESEEAFWEIAAEYGFSHATVTENVSNSHNRAERERALVPLNYEGFNTWMEERLVSGDFNDEEMGLFRERYLNILRHIENGDSVYIDGESIRIVPRFQMRDLSVFPLDRWVKIHVSGHEFVFLLLNDPEMLTPLSPVRLEMMDWFVDFRKDIPVINLKDIINPLSYPETYSMIQAGANPEEIMSRLFNDEQFDITAVLAPNGVVDVDAFL